MLDNLSLVLLLAGLACFGGAVLVADRQFRNALFLVASLTFVGFLVLLAMNDALLNENVRTMNIGR